VPCLRHDGATIWDTLAIGEYLNEVMPDAGLLPADRIQRAHCRSICGEIHSGFTTLRASLPVNLKGHFPGFKIWSRAQADIDRVCTIWRECLAESGGPFLFGERTMADAMYAPVVTRFMTYDVKLEPRLAAYASTIMAMPEMQEWIEAAKAEPADIEELEESLARPCPLEGLRQRAGLAQAGARSERRAAAALAVFREALKPDS
jgi:glutathione S-transferase